MLGPVLISTSNVVVQASSCEIVLLLCLEARLSGCSSGRFECKHLIQKACALSTIIHLLINRVSKHTGEYRQVLLRMFKINPLPSDLTDYNILSIIIDSVGADYKGRVITQ